MEKHLPPVVVRVIRHSYINQQAYIKWGGSVSEVFEVSNGKGESKICSPTFWSIYILPVITKLQKLGLGCHIADVYVASVFFTDDIILISPNRMGAQLMLSTCEVWAKENGIIFSTDPVLSKSKTKAMRITGMREVKNNPAPLILDGQELPYVNTVVHLGHTLSKDGWMEVDTRNKRMSYIAKFNEIKECYGFLDPKELQRIILTHCSTFYGSNL